MPLQFSMRQTYKISICQLLQGVIWLYFTTTSPCWRTIIWLSHSNYCSSTALIFSRICRLSHTRLCDVLSSKWSVIISSCTHARTHAHTLRKWNTWQLLQQILLNYIKSSFAIRKRNLCNCSKNRECRLPSFSRCRHMSTEVVGTNWMTTGNSDLRCKNKTDESILELQF